MLRSRVKLLSLALLGLLFVLNGIAWMQAWSMTHYVESDDRIAPPETLSILHKMRLIVTGVQRSRPTNHHTPETVGLSYEVHTIELSDRERLEAWFIPAVHSQGLVILFPAYGTSKQALLAPSQVFHHLGYDMLLVDFRGVGGSTGSDTTLGIREAKDVSQAMAYAQRQWSEQPIVLYGSSMGAVAIMRAIAHEAVQPAAVILESPFDRLLNTVRNRFDAMGIPAFPSAELLVFWGSQQQDIPGFTHNPIDYAAAISCPVLLMSGGIDQRVTPAEVESIFEAFPGQKQRVIFPDLGHGGLASKAGSQWQQAVQKFLRTYNPVEDDRAVSSTIAG